MSTLRQSAHERGRRHDPPAYQVHESPALELSVLTTAPTSSWLPEVDADAVTWAIEPLPSVLLVESVAMAILMLLLESAGAAGKAAVGSGCTRWYSTNDRVSADLFDGHGGHWKRAENGDEGCGDRGGGDYIG